MKALHWNVYYDDDGHDNDYNITDRFLIGSILLKYEKIPMTWLTSCKW